MSPDSPRLDTILDRVASRRRFLGGAGAAAFALAFLAACGDDEEPEAAATSGPGGTATTAATEAPTAASAFPVTITHKFGSTTVEAEPKRVLSLGYNDQDSILALGFTPIATRYWFSDAPGHIMPWAEDRVEGEFPEVLNMPFDQLDFEKIASLQPDVIVAVYSGITAEDYATLTEIAPVVAQSADYIDYGMPWDEAARLVGAALGRSEEMDQIIADVNAKFAAASAEHAEFAGKELVLAAMRADGAVGLFAEQDGRMRFFASLGFTLPAELEGLFGESFYADISQEQMSLLDSGDVVAWTQVLYAGGADAILTHPVYSQLSVANESRHFLIGDLADEAFSFNSVLSLPYALEKVVPQLVAALDGDPRTNIDYEPKA